MEQQLPRFLMDPKTDGQTVVLSGEEAHHSLAVLRLRPGDQFIAIDGKGNEYLCNLESVVSGRAYGRVIRHSRLTTEATTNITLAIGLPRPSKMDLIVQKTTELGVRRIVPLLCQGCYTQAGADELVGRTDRWHRIAVEAAKQSLRSVVPKVANPVKMNDFEKIITQVDLAILFTPKASGNILHQLIAAKDNTSREILAIVGCESGFSIEEEESLRALKVQLCSLGPRRLRTETAAIVAVSMILYESGGQG